MVDINNSLHAPGMHTSNRGFKACRQGGCLFDNETQLFSSSYIELAYIFVASSSTLVTS